MNKRKGFIFLCLCFVLFGGLFSYQKFEENARLQKEEALQRLKENQVAVTTKGERYQAIQSFISDAGYLIENLQQADLDEERALLKQLKNENQQLIAQYGFEKGWLRSIEDAEALLTRIEQKLHMEQGINQLFLDEETRAISGDSFNSRLPLKQSITTTEVQKLQKKLEEMATGPESHWTQLITSTLETIYGQATVIENAKQLLAQETLSEEEEQRLTILINNIKAPETKEFYLAKNSALDPSDIETKVYDKDGNEMSWEKAS